MDRFQVATLATAIPVGLIGFLVRYVAGDRRWPLIAFVSVSIAVGSLLVVWMWDAHSNVGLGVALGIGLGGSLGGAAWELRNWRLQRRSA
jgi:hypothetical protein